jgi:cyclopropane fatty-acyl-phospholipid synthase-like methyltransferase
MDRITWLKALRQECEQKYDTLWAPAYGEKWGLYNNTTHLEFLREFLRLVPQNSALLDAACGAGRYLPFLLEQGHSVIGIDQSRGMLANAGSKFPAVSFEQVGLQEMTYRARFDGAICMDAMENVPPEDWPQVLANFHRALKPHGLLYFTAETIENADENEIRAAFEKDRQAGLPVVFGERLDEEVYHYHPSNRQVSEWTQQAGFEILKEANGELWYYHILLRKQT